MPPKATPRAGANDWTDSQMASIHTMLNPRSVAIVGATPRMQYGGRFLAKALQYKDRLKVFAVNPRYEEVMGVRSYPNVTALPETPDVAAIVVPYNQVLDTLQECHAKGVRAAIVISAGFDAHHRDPLGGLRLTEADFAWITEKLVESAGRHCRGRVVSVLEGGYDLDGLSLSVGEHVRVLMAAGG